MWMVARVLLSTLVVLGLIKGLSYLLSRYAPPTLGGAKQTRRLEVLEATSLPGGVGLYVVRYRSSEIVLAASRDGVTKLHTYSLDGKAEDINVQQQEDLASQSDL